MQELRSDKQYGAGGPPLRLLSLSLSLFLFHFFFLVRFVLFLSVHEGFSDEGGLRGIYSLYVLKAIMGKIGLSQKVPIGTSKRSDVVTVLHFFIFWPTVIGPRTASTAAPVANRASTKRVQL